MGDAVNVTSRLEGFREVDRIKVKSKDEAITTHDAPRLGGEIDRALHHERKLCSRALRLYRVRVTAFEEK
ncbi:MAG: hypothetical protein M3544_08970 [Pseudomonadota bacterium]|nr:hypothetical protein [Pseudomonadota bacterium]